MMEYNNAGIPITGGPIEGVSFSPSPSPLLHGRSGLALQIHVPLRLEESFWQMNLGSSEIMQPVSYPLRDGEPDCSYYIRTGLCRFGATCRFNHPPNRQLVIATARMMGEYPERVGQPECQYYLKTGTCKFGATCKFHHPRDKAGIAGQVALNVLGYPLRPEETECGYYLRTGMCKFGTTCKFHHPQPSNVVVPIRGSPAYPAVQSPTPSQQSYPGGVTNWSLSATSFIPSPRWEGPSTYAPVILPQSVVSMPSWKTYSGEPSSASSPEHLQVQGNIPFYAGPSESGAANIVSQGIVSTYGSGTVPINYYALQNDCVFPERPGQPECQFYMKTGDCKFGGVCKFHHPRERLVPAPDCVLSPLGLPLRPGEPLCIFYSRYGICKFGPSCKFDHPMGVFVHNPPASSSAEASGAHQMLRTSSGAEGLAYYSDGLMPSSSANLRRTSLSETGQMAAGEESANSDE